MLNRTSLRNMVGNNVYNKGLRVYGNSRVHDLEIFELVADEEHITASVVGSYGEDYSVSCVYDKKYDELVECDCDCPAFYVYPGLCKHCVAVLLNYIDEKKSMKGRARVRRERELR